MFPQYAKLYISKQASVLHLKRDEETEKMKLDER